jgi:hypothetical protein
VLTTPAAVYTLLTGVALMRDALDLVAGHFFVEAGPDATPSFLVHGRPEWDTSATRARSFRRLQRYMGAGKAYRILFVNQRHKLVPWCTARDVFCVNDDALAPAIIARVIRDNPPVIASDNHADYMIGRRAEYRMFEDTPVTAEMTWAWAQVVPTTRARDLSCLGLDTERLRWLILREGVHHVDWDSDEPWQVDLAFAHGHGERSHCQRIGFRKSRPSRVVHIFYGAHGQHVQDAVRALDPRVRVRWDDPMRGDAGPPVCAVCTEIMAHAIVHALH